LTENIIFSFLSFLFPFFKKIKTIHFLSFIFLVINSIHPLPLHKNLITILHPKTKKLLIRKSHLFLSINLLRLLIKIEEEEIGGREGAF
jgi:hypothetical protein